MSDYIHSLGETTSLQHGTLHDDVGKCQSKVSTKTNLHFALLLDFFRYDRTLFALQNAPATFHCALDTMLSGVQLKTCLFFSDEVVLFSESIGQFVQDTDGELKLLQQAWVTLKIPKRHYLQNKIEHSGLIHMPSQLPAASKNVYAIETAAFPTNRKKCNHFWMYERCTEKWPSSIVKSPSHQLTICRSSRSWNDQTSQL